MSRNSLVGLVIILVIAVVVVSVYAYQESQRPGLDIHLDNQGLKINGKG